MSNQIKSRTFLRGVKSNQIMILGEKSPPDQIKSNHDLIPISNQNFGCNQNQFIKRSKLSFHRQIWHRSKALSELFPSVPLVLPEVTFLIKKKGSMMISQIQIKSNHRKKGRQIKSNHVVLKMRQIKSCNRKNAPNQIKSKGLKIHPNQIKS